MSTISRLSRLAISVVAAAGVLGGAGSGAWAQESTGVAACDSFMSRYETCIKTKVPSEHQPKFNQTVMQLRAVLTPMASSSPSQAETMCRQVAQVIQQQTAPMGCSW